MRRSLFIAVVLSMVISMPASSQTPQTTAIPANLQGNVICTVGTTLTLSGQFTLRDCKSCLLTSDRKPVSGQTVENDPINPVYAFQWTASTIGTHALSVVYILDNDTPTLARKLTVITTNTAPVTLEALPSIYTKAASGEDLPATVDVAPDFHASKVDFFMDGALVGSASAAPFTVSLPLGGAAHGPHRIAVQAFDTDGNRYFSPVRTVTIPGAVAQSYISVANTGSSSDALGAIFGIPGRGYVYSYAFGEKAVVSEGDFGKHAQLLGYTLLNPVGLAIDNSGHVYVADKQGIALFATDGTFLSSYPYYLLPDLMHYDTASGGMAADRFGMYM